MFTYKNKQYFIDGKSSLIMAGEIHYYRLDPCDWQNRIDRLKEAGMNTVATYIPWVCHELHEGDFDIDGRYNPRHNLRGFVELCEQNGLFVFLRPGPFIMAEMQNDGIPFWVYEKYPEIVACGFDGEQQLTSAVDYLSPNFLDASKKWFAAIMPFFAEHLYPNKGKIIAIQLENEIGMLPWVSNRPLISPFVCEAFNQFLIDTYDRETLSRNYPFEITVKAETYEKFVSPQPGYDAVFHRDFGYFMRRRFAEYVYILKGYCEEYGVSEVQFVINIHGTSGGRGLDYPIGVSQLIETYQNNDNIVNGSDVYFGDYKIGNFQDMYMCNGITDATNKFGKPLGCVEFNCGESNFGDDLNGRDKASSNDFKTRMFIAQGNKLINYYLFCGGQNYRFDFTVGDGCDRIAKTGENHGFSAPIHPDGTPSYIYTRLARVINQIMALEEKYASSLINYDDTAYAFIPDYFMTEYVYKKSKEVNKIFRNIERNRNAAWESSVKGMLLMGLKPQTIDIQTDIIPNYIKNLIVSSAEYMADKLQRKLADFITNGGKIILHGQVPRYDELGKPCTVLADLLEVKNFTQNDSRHQHLVSVVHVGEASHIKEFNCITYETMDVSNAEILLMGYEHQKPCGFYKEVGKGGIVVLSCHYKCYFDFFRIIMEKLDIAQTLSHDITTPGIGVFMTETINQDEEKFIYLINMDDIEKEFNIYLNGEPIIPTRKIRLPLLEALTLPINVKFDFGIVNYATLEILDIKENEIIFRNTEKFSEISITSNKKLIETDYIKYKNLDGTYVITTDNRLLDEGISIRFK